DRDLAIELWIASLEHEAHPADLRVEPLKPVKHVRWRRYASVAHSLDARGFPEQRAQICGQRLRVGAPHPDLQVEFELAPQLGVALELASGRCLWAFYVLHALIEGVEGVARRRLHILQIVIDGVGRHGILMIPKRPRV